MWSNKYTKCKQALSNYSQLAIVRDVCQNAQCHFPSNLHFNNIDILLKQVISNGSNTLGNIHDICASLHWALCPS